MNLQGKLGIKHLEGVKDLKDAREANLIGKKDLHGLFLSWESNGESELRHNAKQIFEGLEPHPHLVFLGIERYMGTQFPLLMRNPVLKNVIRIFFTDCKNCLELLPFGRLSSLRTLDIKVMNYVEYIDNESHGGVVRGFASLKEIRIFDLPSLKRLSIEEGSELFPLLTSFPKFDLAMPCVPQKVRSKEMQWVLLNSISNLHGLTFLSVGDEDEVIPFPNGMLQNLAALQKLNIQRFAKLEVLPTDLSSLIALESLYLWDCHELECLPEEGLRGLTSLQSLDIRFCNKLKSLYEGLQLLTCLQSLHICYCPRLASFPATIQSLTQLHTLWILGCPELKRACEKERGEDWCKISHIPQLIVHEA